MQVTVASFSLVKGDDEVEGVEFLKAVVASSMRFWVEASSLRYQSRLMIKSVMLNWCMTEISSAQSWVCTSWRTCLIVDAVEFLILKGEFVIMLRHLTWRYI